MFKKFFTLFFCLFQLIWLTANAEDQKCVALGNLTATLYRNSDSVNEFQQLRKMEAKSSELDYAFIKLYSGIAFSGQKFNENKLQNESNQFCQKITIAAMNQSSSNLTPATKRCESFVQYSTLINTFKNSGDTSVSIRNYFQKNIGSKGRLSTDYIDLIVALRFSTTFLNRSDAEFLSFSGKVCEAFLDYGKKLEGSK